DRHGIGSFAFSAQFQRLAPAVGNLCADSNPAAGRGRSVRSLAFQRSLALRPEGNDERGRITRHPRALAGRAFAKGATGGAGRTASDGAGVWPSRPGRIGPGWAGSGKLSSSV